MGTNARPCRWDCGRGWPPCGPWGSTGPRTRNCHAISETGEGHAAGCFLDGIMTATGCTFGKGNIEKAALPQDGLYPDRCPEAEGGARVPEAGVFRGRPRRSVRRPAQGGGPSPGHRPTDHGSPRGKDRGASGGTVSCNRPRRGVSVPGEERESSKRSRARNAGRSCSRTSSGSRAARWYASPARGMTGNGPHGCGNGVSDRRDGHVRIHDRPDDRRCRGGVHIDPGLPLTWGSVCIPPWPPPCS